MPPCGPGRQLHAELLSCSPRKRRILTESWPILSLRSHQFTCQSRDSCGPDLHEAGRSRNHHITKGGAVPMSTDTILAALSVLVGLALWWQNRDLAKAPPGRGRAPEESSPPSGEAEHGPHERGQAPGGSEHGLPDRDRKLGKDDRAPADGGQEYSPLGAIRRVDHHVRAGPRLARPAEFASSPSRKVGSAKSSAQPPKSPPSPLM